MHRSTLAWHGDRWEGIERRYAPASSIVCWQKSSSCCCWQRLGSRSRLSIVWSRESRDAEADASRRDASPLSSSHASSTLSYMAWRAGRNRSNPKAAGRSGPSESFALPLATAAWQLPRPPTQNDGTTYPPLPRHRCTVITSSIASPRAHTQHAARGASDARSRRVLKQSAPAAAAALIDGQQQHARRRKRRRCERQ